MKKLCALLFALALPVYAQVVSPDTGVRVKDLTGGSANLPSDLQVLSTSRTYYVETTGNDANTCQTIGSPCLTIQGAVNKIPKRIKGSAVTVSVGAGTFAGVRVDSFHLSMGRPAPDKTYLVIKGTLIPFVPATGTATGTATSGSAGSGATHGTLTDTLQSWTVNNLRGQLIEITGGTGVGQIRAIASNTATAVTIAGFWATAPNATSVYAIRDWGTVINAPHALPHFGYVTVPANPTSSGIATYGDPPATSANADAVTFSQLRNSPQHGTAYGLDSIKFTTVGRAVAGFDTDFFVINSRFDNLATFGNISSIRGGWVFTSHNVYNQPATGVAVRISGQMSMNAMAWVMNSVSIGGSTMVGAGSTVNASGNYVFGATNRAFQVGPAYEPQLFANVIDCNSLPSTVGIEIGLTLPTSQAGSSRSPGAVNLHTNSISNCATAYLAKGPAAVLNFEAAGTGSGNTVGIAVSEGAAARVNSATVLGATTELSLNGVSYTLATLRALTPKSIFELSQGTLVYEP